MLATPHPTPANPSTINSNPTMFKMDSSSDITVIKNDDNQKKVVPYPKMTENKKVLNDQNIFLGKHK